MTDSIDEICQLDFVIDTCVLAHACQKHYPLHESAFSLIEWLGSQSEAQWVLDDNGKKAPAAETSLLYSEYHRTLSPQSLPLMLLARYMRFGLVKFSPRPNQQLRDKVREMIPKNKKDQVVLGAVAGSQDKVLFSNDEDDFPQEVRQDAAAALGVRIYFSDALNFGNSK
ncbi:hypothetical protein QTO28_18195 [Streptomyces sp. P9-2B-1]|uniref:hypothetical protein n=1 Tax=Streptomyces sp. P9-2B-1 TaxID=3057115 RepID=UPI0025B4C6E2|nr:hypothetical protein [Streptomyces sp. P9-2B-1]WJY32807.1 hypothetical protein QTO28_18195 [Streptomyces sp. P9-2B-1]